MNRAIIWVLISLLLVTGASAARVGVVVDMGSTTYTTCIVVDDGADGYEVMEATSLNIGWTQKGEFGHALCNINGIGEAVLGTNCDWGSEYWNFYIADGGDWSYSPVGFDAGSSCWNGDFDDYGGHFCADDGAVIGLAHGEWNSRPQYVTFDTLCPDPIEITDIDVEVDGKRDRGVDEYGGDFDASPWDFVEFTVSLRSVFDSREMPEVKDITMTIEINNIGDDDIEEDSDEFDLGPGDDTEETVDFRVPLDARDKSYSVSLMIEGEYEDGHEVVMTRDFDMNVERESHQLEILSAEFTNTRYSCQDEAVLSVELVNIGDNDEDVELVAFGSGTEVSDGLSIDSDETSPTRVLLNIPIADIDEGSHSFTVRASYGGRSESAFATFLKDECGSKQVAPGAEGQTGKFVVLSGSSAQVTSHPEPVEAESDYSIDSLDSSNLELDSSNMLVFWALGAIILGVLLFLAAIIFMQKG